MSDGPRPSSDKHGAKPEAIVQHWLDVAGRERAGRDQRAGAPAGPHPFVREASQLAVLALKTGYPQRYCWIDEGGVVAQVGSRNTGTSTGQRNRLLWIPPSAGWTAFNGRAQRLIAGVLPPPADAPDQAFPGPSHGSVAADATSAAHRVLGRNGRSRARLASPAHGGRPATTAVMTRRAFGIRRPSGRGVKCPLLSGNVPGTVRA
jgi:hypothetical protein